jgi:hypothetical protein
VALLLLLATAASADAATSPTLVSFRQTGGFAAIDRGLVVERSGALVSDGLPLARSRLTKVELAKLKLALKHARFAGLPERYESKEPIADGFTYQIKYGAHAVSIEQGAQPPLRVRHVFALLSRLVHG